MIVIHTVLKYGQSLMPEVCEGIFKNDCCLIPISSASDSFDRLDRDNIVKNWNTAFKYSDDYYFMGMDSDVVLPQGIAEKILKNLSDYDGVVCRKQDRKGHPLWVVKSEIIKRVPMTNNNANCPICMWLSTASMNYRIQVFPECVGHCERISMGDISGK